MSAIRRAAFAVVVLVALVPTVPASGQEAGAGAGVFQVAEAEWLFLRGDRGTLYLAEAFRAAGGGADTIEGPGAGVTTVGMVARGRCTVQRGGGWVSITCTGRGYSRELAPDQFQIDPLLSSATLRMRAAGFAHRVSWTGRGRRPEIGGGSEFGTFYAGAGAGAARVASAGGRMFGRPVRGGTGPFSFGFLAEVASGGGGAFVPEEPGSFRFERTLRLRADAVA